MHTLSKWSTPAGLSGSRERVRSSKALGALGSAQAWIAGFAVQASQAALRPVAGLVLVSGAQIASDAYAPLVAAIQAASAERPRDSPQPSSVSSHPLPTDVQLISSGKLEISQRSFWSENEILLLDDLMVHSFSSYC